MSERGAVLRRVLGSPSLRRVVLAFLGFSCAEHGTWVSMTVYAYQQGGTGEAALVAIVQLLPAALVAPLGSRLADRRGGAFGLWVSYLAQALTMTVTGALLLADAPKLAVYAFAILAASAVTLTRPAQAALLPTLVETPSELTAANAATGWLESVSYFVGPALAGVFIALTGPGLSFAVFGAGAALAAIVVLPLARRGGHTAIASEEEETSGALAALRAQPGALALLGVMGVQFIGIGALDVLVVVLAIEMLEVDASGAGYLNAAFGAGGIVGGVGALWLVGRQRLVPPLLAAAGAWGVAFVLMGVFPSVAVAFVMFAAAGSAWTMLDVAGRTLMQRAMPAQVRGRVFGVVEGMSQAAIAVGSALIPLFDVLGGPRLAVAATGALLMVAGASVIGLLRNLDRVSAPAEAELALLRGSPLFGMLSGPVLEGLAQSLEPVRAAAGEVVIREGDTGDRFYLIASGTLDVSIEGHHIRVLEPGDGFGEIALLRDGIRTSTVTAREDVGLYALHRRPFLEAVTGHAGARHAIENLASARLAAYQPD